MAKEAEISSVELSVQWELQVREGTTEQGADSSHTEPFSFENVEALWPSGISVRLLTYGSVLISLHCLNKTPQPGWPKEQKYIFSQF